MGFGLQRVSPVASQAGWFMRIKRAIADHGDLAIRGAANADASARRCHACSGVMPAPVSCLLRCHACSGVIAASVCCLASRSPCTGFRRSGRDLRYSPRSITVYAHKRRAGIARWVDIHRSDGIHRCCIPSQGMLLATSDQKRLLPRYDRAPRFPRRVYAHKLSSSQLRRPHRTIGQYTRHARQLATPTDGDTRDATESRTALSGIRHAIRSSHLPSSLRLCA